MAIKFRTSNEHRTPRRALNSRRLWVTAATGLLLTSGLFGTAAAEPAVPPQSNCESITTSVSLFDGGPEDNFVYGELCGPPGESSDTVQLLLPGGTYNHNYWDFPYQKDRYSYVQHMTKTGHKTFNIDRVGTGQSSHPLGATLSVQTGGFVAHQIVTKLRKGEIGASSFKRVVLVGHSLGSSVLWSEASTYRDVDGVIVTGMAHPPAGISADSVPKYRNLTYPAILEPRFQNRDATYITTIPGTRGDPLFYEPGNFDPEVPKIDEKTKDTITAAELATFPGLILDGTSSRISVPTLVVLGQKDAIFCGAIGGVDCSTPEGLRNYESNYYPPEAELEAFLLPGAGHDINLHRNAPEFFNVADEWVARRFG